MAEAPASIPWDARPVEEWYQMVQDAAATHIGQDPSEDAVVIKITVFGDSQVGKTSLIRCFTTNTPIDSHTPINTIGVDLHCKRVNVDGFPTRVMLWDTAGQERYNSITLGYARDTKGIVLVYDIGDRGSCANILRWMDNIQQQFRDPHNPPPILVMGNKSDRPPFERQVNTEDAHKLFEALGFFFLECSARTAEHVQQAFYQLFAMIHMRNVKRAKLREQQKPVPAILPFSRTIKLPTDLKSIPLKTTEFTLLSEGSPPETAAAAASNTPPPPRQTRKSYNGLYVHKSGPGRPPTKYEDIDYDSGDDDDSDDPDESEDLDHPTRCAC